MKHELHHKYTDYSIFFERKKIDLLLKKIMFIYHPSANATLLSFALIRFLGHVHRT